MGTLATGYRGTQVFNTNGYPVETAIDVDTATWQDWLDLYQDVALAIAACVANGVSPSGMPAPTTNSPLTTTEAVIQQAPFQPNASSIYGVCVYPLSGSSEPIYIRATNESTSRSPIINVHDKTSNTRLIRQAGSSGAAVIEGTVSLITGHDYNMTVIDVEIGKSTVNWWQATQAYNGAPSITNTSGVISITKHANAPSGTELFWRKKNSGWIWQPYSGPFTKPSGSYTIEARGFKVGYMDNQIGELAVT